MRNKVATKLLQPMLTMQATPYLRMIRLSRSFSTSLVKWNTTNGPKNAKEAKKFSVLDGQTYFPTKFDKMMLVWIKRYPSINDVPREVKISTITESRSKARVKICNYFIVGGILACIYTVYCAKQAEKNKHRPDEGLAFHNQLREDYIDFLNKEQDKQ